MPTTDDAEGTAARARDAADDGAAPAVAFVETVPILRIFDEAKAREFYCGFLGFAVDWEHRFEPGAPLYAQLSRGALTLHLSEHHGDASPGSTVFVRMRGIRAFHRELLDRRYRYNRPGLEREPWGEVVQVHDPFGNRIRFCEHPADDREADASDDASPSARPPDGA